MTQFLIPPNSREGDIVTLDGSDARHLRDALRARVGEAVRLFDGNGTHYQGKVQSTSKNGVSVLVGLRLPAESPRTPLLFAQSILKGDKMDFVIQKAAELGVSSFLPFVSSRTIVRIDPKKDKTTRWQKIAQEASKQCGRATHMIVDPPVTFKTLLEKTEADVKIIFWEESREPLRRFFQRNPPLPPFLKGGILVLIGPEGGFSKDEIDLAVRRRFTALSLGSTILKAETAAIAAMSLIQYELGNI